MSKETTVSAQEYNAAMNFRVGKTATEEQDLGMYDYMALYAKHVTAEKDATISKLQSENEELKRTVNSNGLHVVEQIKFRVDKVVDEYVVAFGNSDLTDKK